MTNLTKSTKSSSQKEVKREWHLIDAKGQIVGRVASQITKFLQGKHKTGYVSYLDMGDNVVVINAKDVTFSGTKVETKEYTYFSGYPGGLRKVKASDLLKKNPKEIIYQAVSGMLPKNKHRQDRLARLFIFSEANHTFGDKLKI